MTFDQLFILKRIEQIEGYLNETKDLFQSSDQEILQNYKNLHTAERLLQLIVDELIDINQHFIRELGLEPTEDFQSTFYTLAEKGVLSKEFAEALAPVVGLRNIIVHRYEKLDKELFIRTFRKRYADFEKFMEIIINQSSRQALSSDNRRTHG